MRPIFLFLLLTFLPPSARLSSSSPFAKKIREENESEKYYKRSRFNVAKMVKAYGYPIEIHHVITEDGYILKMHRIPGPKFSHVLNISSQFLPGRGNAIYIQHCIFCSSSHFIVSGPDQALAFALADAGFDVWLGNYRGNVHSRKHMFLNPENSEFWLFSFMEMAKYDVPAMMKHVIKKTNREKIFYIGHSMGTTGFFAALSTYPDLNKHIKAMVALAPVAYMDHTTGPFREFLIFSRSTFRFWETIRMPESLPLSQTREDLAVALCQSKSILSNLCQSFIPVFAGINRGYIDPKNLPAVLSVFPAGTSFRAAAHLGQLIGPGRFQMFDMGPENNMKEYGNVVPPEFNLSNIRVPIGFFWSDNDIVAAPQDVARLARNIPNLALNYRVPQEDFNHSDFLFGKTAKTVLYKAVLQFLLSYL